MPAAAAVGAEARVKAGSSAARRPSVRRMPGLKRLLKARLGCRRCSSAQCLFWGACWAVGGGLFAFFFLAHGGVFSGRCTDEQSRRILAKLVGGSSGVEGARRGICP